MEDLIGKHIYGEFIKLNKNHKIPIKPGFEIFELLDTKIFSICKSSLHNEYIVNSFYLVPSDVVERVRKYS